MDDIVENTIQTLETAYAEHSWELVIDAIRLLNEIPKTTPPDFNDEDGYPDNLNSMY